MTGSIDADVSASFGLAKGGKIKDVDWKADVSVKNGASTAPIQGRTFANADLKIAAQPGLAKIDGVATIDGVEAKIAMVEHPGENKKGERIKSCKF